MSLSPPPQDHLVPQLHTILTIGLTPPSPHHGYKHALSCAHRVMGKECHPLPTPRALGSHTHCGSCSLRDRHMNAAWVQTHTQDICLIWDPSRSLPIRQALGVL